MELTDNASIVGFLDILGFSTLTRQDIKSASENIKLLQDSIKTKYFDTKCIDKTKPKDEESLANSVIEEHEFSFPDLISISDSVIVVDSAKFAVRFVRQISNFVAYFVRCSLTNDESFGYQGRSRIIPILFRGGISVGDVRISYTFANIQKGAFKGIGMSVLGSAYTDAVKLEPLVKGPRLCMDSKTAKFLRSQLPDEERDVIRKVKDKVDDKAIYEIIWPYYACMGSGSSLIEDNADKSSIEIALKRNTELFKKKFLDPAEKYYERLENQKMTEDVLIHYEKLIEILEAGKKLYNERYSYRNRR